MNLYELTAAIQALQEIDDPQAIADTIEGMEGDIAEVAEEAMKLYANNQAQVAALDHEQKRLKARRDSIEARSKGVRAAVLKLMGVADVKSLNLPLYTLSRKAGSESVVVHDASLIPEQYVEVEMKTVPQKAAIKAAIKAGEDVPGVTLVRGDAVLQVRS